MTFLATSLAASGGTAAAGAAGTATAATGASLASTLVGTGVAAVGQMGPFMPTAGLFGAGGGVTMAGLANGLTLASVGSFLFGSAQQSSAMVAQSEAQAESLKFQSQEQKLAAQQDATIAKQESNTIMDNMIQTIAAQRLAAAGNGVDISFGTPQNVEKATRDLGNLQMSTSREDAQIRILSRRRQSASIMRERGNVLASGYSTARNNLVSGASDAGAALGENLMRRSQRG